MASNLYDHTQFCNTICYFALSGLKILLCLKSYPGSWAGLIYYALLGLEVAICRIIAHDDLDSRGHPPYSLTAKRWLPPIVLEMVTLSYYTLMNLIEMEQSYEV